MCDAQGIDQPVICLDNGDSLVWDVSNVDTPAGESKHFPVYLKDSLFNSNPDFDYGPFRQLAEFMDDGVNLKNFVYVFQDAGTYVFGDNADNSLITVVSVMEPTARVRSPSSYCLLPHDLPCCVSSLPCFSFGFWNSFHSAVGGWNAPFFYWACVFSACSVLLRHPSCHEPLKILSAWEPAPTTKSTLHLISS